MATADDEPWLNTPIIRPFVPTAPTSDAGARTEEDQPWLQTPIVRPLAPPGQVGAAPPPQTTARNVARNVAAGAVQGGAGVIDMVTDPFGTVIGPGLARIGGTLYDAGAHLFGYPAMSPELRAALYGQDGLSDPGIGTQAVNAADQVIPGPKLADVRATTPAEELARKAAAGAVAGAATGPSMLAGGIVGGGGAATGDIARRFLPDWAMEGGEMLTNVLAGYGLSHAVSPVQTVTTPERQRLVGELQAEGVPLTAGERSGSKVLQKTEQILGQTPGAAGRVSEQVATQQAAINRAVASRAGLDSDTLTPDVLNAHMKSLGQDIDRIASANTMELPTSFVLKLGQLQQNLKYMKTDAAQEIGARIDQLRDMITVDPTTGNPVLTGKNYQTLVSDLRDAITGATGTTQSNLIQFRDTLRQQMEASMTPQDAAAWRELNRKYANGAVIRDAMGAAGAGTAEGNISLLQLRGAINRSMGSDAYAQGYGDLNDLARAGQSVLRRPPDSGSPQGIAINRLLNYIEGGAAALGGGTGAYLGNWEGAAIGAPLGFMAPAAVGAVYGSRPVQAYLTNQLMRGIDPRIIAAVSNAAARQNQAR